MPRVHVLGPLACDRVYHVDRLPGHDEKAFAMAYREVVGGPPLWVAAHLAAWGVPVALHSIVGDDDAGRTVIAELDRRGIDTSAVARPDGVRTATPVVIVDRTGEKAIVIDALPEAALLQVGTRLAPAADDWMVSNLFHADAVAALVARARAAGAATFIDLELPELERAGFRKAMDAVAGADVICTNAQLLAWWRPHERADQVATAAAFARTLAEGRRTGIVTLGAAGAVVAERDRVVHIAAPATSPVNTTGAGDTFAAGFVRARLDGKAVEPAAKTAVAAASLFVAARPTDWDAVTSLAASIETRHVAEAGVR